MFSSTKPVLNDPIAKYYRDRENIVERGEMTQRPCYSLLQVCNEKIKSTVDVSYRQARLNCDC